MPAGEIVAHEAELGAALRRNVVDQGIGILQQSAESAAVFAATKIQRDAALVGVQKEEDAARLGIRLVPVKRTATTERITLGRFYLDDVGPEVGEHLRRERGRHSFAILDDSETLDCFSACGVCRGLLCHGTSSATDRTIAPTPPNAWWSSDDCDLLRPRSSPAKAKRAREALHKVSPEPK